MLTILCMDYVSNYPLSTTERNFMLTFFFFYRMGIHDRTTVTMTRTATGKSRVLSDDDPHVTIRMGPDRNTCQLHGHLYIHMAEKQEVVNGVMRKSKVATRLMTEHERNYVDGKPRHLWIWGPYNKESVAWPRSQTVLPKPPFVKKPGRGQNRGR